MGAGVFSAIGRRLGRHHDGQWAAGTARRPLVACRSCRMPLPTDLSIGLQIGLIPSRRRHSPIQRTFLGAFLPFGAHGPSDC